MEKKHYFTETEKKEFLKILKKYNHIVDTRANDSVTLRRKNIAWNRIACEYNTSSIAPYPASSKQLRRLWMNLKQRQKSAASINSIIKMEPAQSTKDENPEDNIDMDNDDSDRSTPYFVNIDSQSQFVKPIITVNESEVYTPGEPNTQAFNIEFIDDDEEEAQSNNQQSPADKNLGKLKSNILMREFHDRRRRLNELHQLQKRLLLEQIKEARAKASLAELDLQQHQYLSDD